MDMNIKKHVLIVDDDAMSRRLFGAKLASAGFEILYAKDGNEGREMARRFQPDLVIMDIRMPVMGGVEAAARMKKEPETLNIPIIFLTNEDLSIEAQKALAETGIAGYLSKGSELKELITLVNKVLGL